MKKPVFFSGGTALRGLSQYFAKIKFPTVHLVTTFDSGGSSAALRKAFSIPAVGDLRNRLLALADPEKTSPAVIAFCNSRLPKDVSLDRARQLLDGILDHPLLNDKSMPQEFRHIIRLYLSYFLQKVPKDFDARNASLGNLLLTSYWLKNNGDLEAALSFFTSLFHICGVIEPIVNSSLHLGARLKNGEIIVGQHLFAHLPSPVRYIFLTVYRPDTRFNAEESICRPPATERSKEYLRQAELICYPMGSFYSSILVNLLPEGVGKSIASSRASKIFIPNSGADPESGEISLAEQTFHILEKLREDAPGAQTSDLLNYVLLDLENGNYPARIRASISSLTDMGIKILNRPLVQKNNPACHSPEAVFMALREISDKGGKA